VPEEDMRRTFNLGVGLILVVSPREADRVIRSLRRQGERPMIIGEVA
jgi:phosphoribosylformylglycinamidine cyclo-ligase